MSGRQIWIPISVALFIACSGTQPVATTPATPDDRAVLAQHAVDAVLWQHTSSEARMAFLQAYELAALKLEANLARHAERRAAGLVRTPAVIVDVDETVLDNSLYEVERIAMHTTYDSASWAAWVLRQEAVAIPGALEFLQLAERRGCTIFYLTNRSQAECKATVYNLRAKGFPMADEDHVWCMEASGSDKTARRARVASSYDIVLLVGDQLRDFDERFKDRNADYGRELVSAYADTLQRYFVLLPNPMYGTWRDHLSGKGTDAEKAARIRLFFSEFQH
ncbi:MAG: hypothetical protein JNM31_03870 [Flavobacteriales bacterium]|nr:hypothetical protein [Flavobacteriales bacterium]